jgi:hypothetical protein
MIKKLFFAIFAILFSIAAISQQQPENPGFENWEDVGLNEDEPLDWSSIKTADVLGGFAPYVWEQSTDAHTGTYSVKLFNVQAFGVVAAGTLTSGRIHADFNPDNGYAYTDEGDSQWNMPLTQKPDSVVIWAKFSPMGGDTAAVKALLHNGYAQLPDPTFNNWISLAQINIPNETTTWTRFSAPFSYFNGNTPEYILFVLSAGGAGATVGSTVYFDDIELIYNRLSLDLTVLLEGPYEGNGQMKANLNPSYLPLAQPFNTTPWDYAGTELVAAIPNTNVVDWVLVELRDAANAATATSATTIARQAGFLLRDGSIVGLDGIGRLDFDNTISENMFVVVMQRNHLGVMSADPLVKTNGFYAYDFTDASAKTYGGTNGIKQLSELGPSVWGMIGGDGDANGTVNNIDKTSFWSILAGKTGYLSGDYNMDGQINNTDKNNVWLNNIDETTQIPN